ncbi:MAG: glycosyltransferase [Flavobacteriales bacterium]
MIVDVIIPAFNEEEAVGHVVRDIPKELVREVVVVNNASSDRTRQRAEEAGATVLDQPLRGYGNACLMGIAHLRDKERHSMWWCSWTGTTATIPRNCPGSLRRSPKARPTC